MKKHIPNALTFSRGFLAIIFFALLSILTNKKGTQIDPYLEQIILDTCLAIFAIAGLTDTLDGYFARRWNLTSDLGRIMDPFMDKITVCGAFIFLMLLDVGISAWMVTLIIAREFLVNGLRAYIEKQGGSFGSSMWGKLKTVIQFFAICLILFYRGHFRNVLWAGTINTCLIWITISITLVSGLIYIVSAVRMLRANDSLKKA